MKLKVLSIMLVVIICLSAVSVSAVTSSGTWQSEYGPYGTVSGTYEFQYNGNAGASAYIYCPAGVTPDGYMETIAQIFFLQPGSTTETWLYDRDRVTISSNPKSCYSFIAPPSGTTATWSYGNVCYYSQLYGSFGKYWNSQM